MYNCQYRLPDGVCHGDHPYVKHIRSLPESERTATHNLDGSPIACGACNRPIGEHERWTDEDVRESAAATYARPVRTSSGWTLYAPLSPTIIGQYRGHDPRPLPTWRARALAGNNDGARDLTGALRA